MESDDVRAFVSVADSGSLSLAALDLHVTQSAVTRRLQRLESSLGAVLLDRSTRPPVADGSGICLPRLGGRGVAKVESGAFRPLVRIVDRWGGPD
jgi:DNA-binding transcriptional LysR family regulator